MTSNNNISQNDNDVNSSISKNSKNDTRFSIDDSDDIKFSKRDNLDEQIEKVLHNTYDKNNHVYICDTPQFLVDTLGVHKLPMLLTNNHTYSMTVSEEKAREDGRYKKNTHYHDLGKERMVQLPEKIKEPVMILKSNTDLNNLDVVVVTDMVDNKNRPVIVAIKPYGKGNYYNVEIDTNLIKSGYGRRGFYNYINDAIKENRILYVNKKSSQQIKNGERVQFPNSVLSIDYNNSLSQYKQIVNNYYMQNFENDTKNSAIDNDYLSAVKSADTVTYDDKGKVIPLSERFDNEKSDIRFSKRDNVVDENGNVYSKVIEINQDIFKGIKPREWKKPLRNFVQNELAGQQITVFDNNGNEKVIEFARKNERVRKNTDKNNRKVLGKLENKKDRNSQLAVANSVELVEVSFYSSENKEHSHQWLDENGWEFRKSYMMLPDRKIYEVSLNIGKSRDGRNILYDINKIQRVGMAMDFAKKRRSQKSNSLDSETISQFNENVK